MQNSRTYAEKLGWPSNARVVLFHTDDAGLCASANAGTIEAASEGLATSFSIMMPCPGAKTMAAWCRDHPEVDAGVHLTLTSEFRDFRWQPLTRAPSLRDPAGYSWPQARDVATQARLDEAGAEIRTQIAAARDAGVAITHVDCHMGTVFLSPALFRVYIQAGAEAGVPVLVAGGGRGFSAAIGRFTKKAWCKLAGRARYDFPRVPAELVGFAWESGMPVVDRIHADSYGWPPAEKPARMARLMETLPPGITVVLLHCARDAGDLDRLEGAGPTRIADTEAMVSPEVKAAVARAGIHRTTWRELQARRKARA